MTVSEPDVRPPHAAGDGPGVPPPAAAPKPPKPPGGSFTSRALILALVLGTLLLALSVPVRSWFAQRAQIADLRANVEATEARVAELQLQKQRWEDPNFIAAEARRRLHFVLPGEVGYVTLGTEEETLAGEDQQAQESPWFQILWGAVREADASVGANTGAKADANTGAAKG